MELTRLIFDIILVIIGLYYIFFKSYFQKKGQNLATKEDIGKITSEIEIVKNEISLQTQRQSDLFFERKKCLIGFYESYLFWINESLRFADVIITHFNNTTIVRDTINDIKEAQRITLNHYYKIGIYVEDKDFNTKVTEVLNNTIKDYNTLLLFLIELEDTASRYENIIKRANSLKSQEQADLIEQELKDNKSKRNLAFKNFGDNISSMNSRLQKNSKLIYDLFNDKILNEYSIDLKRR